MTANEVQLTAMPLRGVDGWLAERGWAAINICGLSRRPLDDALRLANMLFVPGTSVLRRDNRWA
jgi:hypothetical protein